MSSSISSSSSFSTSSKTVQNSEPLVGQKRKKTFFRYAVCQKGINSITNIFRWIKGAKPEIGTSASQNLVFAHELFYKRDLIPYIFDFLDKPDLRIVSQVNRLFHASTNTACKLIAKRNGLIPINPLLGVNYKYLLLNRNDITPDFYQSHLGKVDVIVPIPRDILERFRLGLKLIYIPEYITIDATKFSTSIRLDETAAVDGKKAKLVRADEENGELTIRVPMTLSNIIFLFKHLPESKFEGTLDFFSDVVLAEIGDIGLGASHWSCQQEVSIGVGESYHEQDRFAQEIGFELVSLQERILFQLLSNLQPLSWKTKLFFKTFPIFSLGLLLPSNLSNQMLPKFFTGRFPPLQYAERTSTIICNHLRVPRPAVISWQGHNLDSPFTVTIMDRYIYLANLANEGPIGAAIGLARQNF